MYFTLILYIAVKNLSAYVPLLIHRDNDSWRTPLPTTWTDTTPIMQHY